MSVNIFDAKAELIADKLPDGYWIETFYLDAKDKYPGILAFGLGVYDGTRDIHFFDNPKNTGENSWAKRVVATFKQPVTIALGDVAGNGRQDIFVGYHYGQHVQNIDATGGFIHWLQNPGREAWASQQWDKQVWESTKKFVGRWPAMHRMKCGYFTQNLFLELVALPVVRGLDGPFPDLESAFKPPVPVLIYQRPHDVDKATEWPRVVIDDGNFTLIHEGTPKRFYSKQTKGRDSIFLSSREGVTWVYYNTTNNTWVKTLIGAGLPQNTTTTRVVYGTGSLDVARVHDNPAGYIACTEPFHGPTVSVYIPHQTDPESVQWKRHLLDKYGSASQQIGDVGTGPGHHIYCADFDHDGVDEFLVALMGPPVEPASTPVVAIPSPHRGVYYYKALDLQKGIFAKWKVADESAARIAVAGFKDQTTNPIQKDFATITYNVKNYHEDTPIQLHLYKNLANFSHNPPVLPAPYPGITATLWGNQPLFILPKPKSVTTKDTIIIDVVHVAGYDIKLNFAPPSSVLNGNSHQYDAIKVLWGRVKVQDEGNERSPFYAPPNKTVSSKVVAGKSLTAGSDGAVYLSFKLLPNQDPGSWTSIEQVKVEKKLGFSYQNLDKYWSPSWKKYFADPDSRKFWNLQGLYFRWNDYESTQIAYVQFWACGKDVSCGFHNHNDDIFQEIHLCLSQGTGDDGGMRIKNGDVIKALPVPTLYEHGPLWDINADGSAKRRPNGSVSYPEHEWHGGSKKDGLDIWAVAEYNPDLKY